MARIRTIKPSFFTSLTTARLSERAQLTFIGLWGHCDDAGRCVYEPRLFKAAIWPLNDAVDIPLVVQLVAELSAVLLVELYTIDGRQYLQVRNWKEHQKIDRPQASSIPAPREGSMIAPGLLVEDSTNARRTLDDHSLLEGKGKEGIGKEGRTSLVRARKRVALDGDVHFEAAWAGYPRRAGSNSRAEAASAWNAQLARGVKPGALLDGMERYRRFCEAEGKIGTGYVMQASRFFGPAGFWSQEWIASPPPAKKAPKLDPFLAVAQRLAAADRAANGQPDATKLAESALSVDPDAPEGWTDA